jgi:DNA mismatch repair endonuclease MutH
MIYKTKEEVLRRAHEAVGVRFGDLMPNDSNNSDDMNKGSIGNLIQEYHFGYPVNSRAEADFVEAGVELKVTPYKRVQNGISAKERLVLNIIDYMNEYKNSFETSSFWTKNNTIQLMFYEYVPELPRTQWFVSHVYLWELHKESQLYQFKQDWQLIRDMIAAGRAHELSEGMTMYLGACTKGKDSTSTRLQPFSSESAKQRAYSIKSAFMSIIVNEIITNTRLSLPSIYSVSTKQNKPFEQYIVNRLQSFIGRTRESLSIEFGVDLTNKSANSILVGRMLNVDGMVNKTEEFVKSSIVIKTIVVDEHNKLRESMSFPYFRFKELAVESSWEESAMYDYFESSKFLFVVFQRTSDEQLIFRGVKFWSMSTRDITAYGEVWRRAVHAVKEGNELLFPKQSDHAIGHVRPHAKNKQDTDEMPNGTHATKRCFWLNSGYVLSQISDLLNGTFKR